MKNLKKLSVVLFATLLSFNFTSCIDDGVSEAVDQVYLAQAEFLRAQSALQNAKAQYELARAAHEQAEAALTLAEAEVELAYARETDAYTDGVILDNEAQAETNAYNAALNVQTLATKQAELEVALQTQATLLARAISAHEVAMVQLGEAVAAAKDVILLGLYADYNWVTGEVNDQQEARLEAQAELAYKSLMLIDFDGDEETVDPVRFAFYQMQLENDLAALQADKATAEAALAAASALTADDASDSQKLVTDFNAQIDAIDAQIAAKQIEKGEAQVAADLASDAWAAANSQYTELIEYKGYLTAAKAALKEHNDDISDWNEEIEEYQENIDVNIPAALAALAAVDTTTAYDAIQAQIALIGSKDASFRDDDGDVIAWPNGDETPIADPVTLNDLWFNAAIEEEKTENEYNTAYNLIQGFAQDIRDLEDDLEDAEADLMPWTQAEIDAFEDAWNDATDAEETAQNAWEAAPNGLTIVPGADGEAGENQGGTGQTWALIDNFGLSGASFDMTNTFDSFASVLLFDGGAAMASDPLYGNLIAGDLGTWFDVEADDTPLDNSAVLEAARIAAIDAEDTYNDAAADNAAEQKDYDDALADLQAAYEAVGAAWGTGGFIDLSDFNAIVEYVGNSTDKNGLWKLMDDAGDAENDAQDDVEDAEGDLGEDFRPGDTDDKPWTNEFSEWFDQEAGDLEEDDYTVVDGEYQPLEEEINADGDLARLYKTPHTGNNVTLYQALRNSYFELVWAMEAVEALGSISDNEDWIEGLLEDIAEAEALIPSHEYAVDYAQAQYDAKVAEFGFDLTLWDFEEGDHNEGQPFGDLPLFTAYLDALQVVDGIQNEIDALEDAQGYVEDLLDDVVDFLQDEDESSVADFLEAVATDIGELEETISDLTLDIEIQEVMVAQGINNKADMEAWIEECQRRIDVIQTKIDGLETAASNLLARINALLAS